MKNKTTLYIVQGAVIAALYATMTILQNVLLPGSASMAVQFRISDATLLAAISMYLLRNVRLFKLPVLAALMPALFNGIIIGAEIDIVVMNNGQGFNFADFLVQGGLVALGELAVLFVLGLPLSRVIELNGLDKKLFAPKGK